MLIPFWLAFHLCKLYTKVAKKMILETVVRLKMSVIPCLLLAETEILSHNSK